MTCASRCLLLAWAALLPTLPHAQALSPALRSTDAGYEQRLGAALPAAARFTDADGRATTLAALLADVRAPLLLVLGYHRCPQLCGLVLQGALEAVHASGLPARAAPLVFVSIDRAEGPADAAARRDIERAYARFLDPGGTPPAMRFLVGDAAAVEALARSVGFRYGASRAAAAPFDHPAAIVVVTPQGHVSRYLMGVRPDPAELRDAVRTAAAGDVGAPTDAIALLCAHVESAALGTHTAAVLAGLRATLLLVLAGLATWIVRRARRPA